ncbi:unnamed protein product [Phaeothamnion confervicola]
MAVPTCSICLEGLKKGMAVTHCGHVFHEACLAQYVSHKSRAGVRPVCPACKQRLPKKRYCENMCAPTQSCTECTSVVWKVYFAITRKPSAVSVGDAASAANAAPVAFDAAVDAAVGAAAGPAVRDGSMADGDSEGESSDDDAPEGEDDGGAGGGGASGEADAAAVAAAMVRRLEADLAAAEAANNVLQEELRLCAEQRVQFRNEAAAAETAVNAATAALAREQLQNCEREKQLRVTARLAEANLQWARKDRETAALEVAALRAELAASTYAARLDAGGTAAVGRELDAVIGYAAKQSGGSGSGGGPVVAMLQRQHAFIAKLEGDCKRLLRDRSKAVQRQNDDMERLRVAEAQSERAEAETNRFTAEVARFRAEADRHRSAAAAATAAAASSAAGAAAGAAVSVTLVHATPLPARNATAQVRPAAVAAVTAPAPPQWTVPAVTPSLHGRHGGQSRTSGRGGAGSDSSGGSSSVAGSSNRAGSSKAALIARPQARAVPAYTQYRLAPTETFVGEQQVPNRGGGGTNAILGRKCHSFLSGGGGGGDSSSGGSFSGSRGGGAGRVPATMGPGGFGDGASARSEARILMALGKQQVDADRRARGRQLTIGEATIGVKRSAPG